MANLGRINSRQRKMLYAIILAKQGGEFCAICGRTRKQLVRDGLTGELCIDHKDNRNNHNHISNLQLKEKEVNLKKSNKIEKSS